MYVHDLRMRGVRRSGIDIGFPSVRAQCCAADDQTWNREPEAYATRYLTGRRPFAPAAGPSSGAAEDP